jgi:TfoX/Sxy family transcriptional regulator of competence genes
MAYDEQLADRITELLKDQSDLIEKKMFGGIGYLLRGNMACGVTGGDLIVRVGREDYADALVKEFTKPFDMTGRAMTGWVVVTPEGISTDNELWEWVDRGIQFALSLPPKI